MTELSEFENMAYSLCFDHIRDWYRENISDREGDWEKDADVFANRVAAEFEWDMSRCAKAFLSLYLDMFKSDYKKHIKHKP